MWLAARLSRHTLLLRPQGCNMPLHRRKIANVFMALQCGSRYSIRPNSGETPLKTATSRLLVEFTRPFAADLFSRMGAAGPLSRPRAYALFLRRCGASRRGGRAGQRRGLPAAPMCHLIPHSAPDAAPAAGVIPATLATFGSGRVNTRFPPYRSLRKGDNRRIEKDPGYR
jgi:hypothetical protein